ncbi:MAG TPA: aminoglycoside nucleotidyltransferase [Candidatus Saccharimonadia bacterium]|nr:aminoglycoside nucleotidyltransferase [Candidatus Saccharimonadia bacterium]
MISASNAVTLYTAFQNLNVATWLDGGWGVDALLGEQTRDHSDLDIVIQQKDVPTLRKFLESKGFSDVQRNDTSVWNFVLGDPKGHLVDVHVIVLDKKGNGLYGAAKGGAMYPAASLTGKGLINTQLVNCISPEYMIKFHSGYTLRESDVHDVRLLCTRFGIPLPFEYKNYLAAISS